MTHAQIPCVGGSRTAFHRAWFDKGLLGLLMLACAVASPANAQDEQVKPAADAAVMEKIQKVGDFQFRILSLRVPTPKFTSGNMTKNSTATLSIEATNLSNAPIRLGYIFGSAELSDDTGHSFKQLGTQEVAGVGTVRPNKANSQYVAEPGQPMRITFKLRGHFGKNEPLGNVYTFNAEFVALSNTRDGNVELVRRYPLSYVDIPMSGAAEMVGDMPGEILDGIKRGTGFSFNFGKGGSDDQ